MSLDDLGRRAAHDLGRASDRLEPSLPTAGELAERGRRRRAMRSAVGLVVVLVVLLAGAAFAGPGGNDGGTTDVASDGESTVPADELVATTATTGPDECDLARDEFLAGAPTDGAARLFGCLEPCDESDAAEGADGCASATTSTSPSSVPDSVDDATTSTSIAVLPPDGGTVPPDGTYPPTPPPVEDPPTTPHTPPPPPPSTTTIPASDHAEKVLVSGRVTAGPTCPVESPDTACDPVGIVATITFTLLGGREGPEEHTVTSGADGKYAIQLYSAGRYSVTATSDAALSCDGVTVDISMAAPVTLDISCDTGIR